MGIAMMLALAIAAAPAASLATTPTAPPIPVVVVTPAAPPAPSGPPPSAAALEQARRVQELIEPHARMVAGNLQGWEATVKRSMQLDPGFPKIEQAYPGVGAAAIEAARPIARIFCEQFVDRVSAYKVDFYAHRLTPQELAEVATFLESRAGRNLVERMIANVNPDALADQFARQAVEQGRAGFTMEQAQQIDRDVAAKTARQTEADDLVAMMRFQHSAAGQKFMQARHDAEPGILQIVNSPDRELVEKQHDAMQAAILAYIDRKKAH